MSEGNDCAIGVKEPLRHEFTGYLVISSDLCIVFRATELYKAALLAAHGARFVPLGFALAKAQILGKSVRKGETVRVGTAR